jgi:hypothetical protein
MTTLVTNVGMVTLFIKVTIQYSLLGPSATSDDLKDTTFRGLAPFLSSGRTSATKVLKLIRLPLFLGCESYDNTSNVLCCVDISYLTEHYIDEFEASKG